MHGSHHCILLHSWTGLYMLLLPGSQGFVLDPRSILPSVMEGRSGEGRHLEILHLSSVFLARSVYWFALFYSWACISFLPSACSPLCALWQVGETPRFSSRAQQPLSALPLPTSFVPGLWALDECRQHLLLGPPTRVPLVKATPRAGSHLSNRGLVFSL